MRGIALLALLLAAPTPLLVAGACSSRTPEERAVETMRPIAERDGFSLRDVVCEPWKEGGTICELCYSDPEHLLGWARVWCGRRACEWILDVEDRRMEGAKFGEECSGAP